jgi:hypothetical protein
MLPTLLPMWGWLLPVGARFDYGNDRRTLAGWCRGLVRVPLSALGRLSSFLRRKDLPMRS